MTKGFLPSSAWSRQKTPLPIFAECGACGLHKHCTTPFMPVAGRGRRRVLFVAEGPGEVEDREGQPLLGNSGGELSRLLAEDGVFLQRDAWITNSIICRSFDHTGNLTPTTEQINYCRPNLARTIAELQPDVIIPLGKPAMQSLLPLIWKDVGGLEAMKQWAGWQIPSQKANCWVCPTYHPSFLLHEKEGQAAELHVRQHLRAAFQLKGKPWPTGKPNYASHVAIESDPRLAGLAIQEFITAGRPVAFDLETTCLKPDGPHARILCCSVSDGMKSLAYPWCAETAAATKELVQSALPKVGANCKFEERWCRKFLRTRVCNWFFDTVVGQHWLDCRHGICALKFQAFVRFGAEDWDYLLKSSISAKGDDLGGNQPNTLDEEDPETLQTYCAIDSLMEIMVAREQAREGNIPWPGGPLA